MTVSGPATPGGGGGGQGAMAPSLFARQNF